MSTIHSAKPKHARTNTHPPCVCTITWTIARQALTKAQPGLGFATTSSRPTELRISLTSDHQATAELVDPAADRIHTFELGTLRITIANADPFTHIEIIDGTDTVLSATLKAETNINRLLYARTTLLSKLNIKGGRYPAPTITL